jgi:glyoxylase I family protein
MRYFTIQVPDLRGLLARLESLGIKPFMPITEVRPGVTVAMVSDPDGNTVEFLQAS